MTAEDRALDCAMRMFPAGYERDHAKAIVADAIRAAESEAREACAAICDRLAETSPDALAAKNFSYCASSIRALLRPKDTNQGDAGAGTREGGT